ncbi:hypothetical protein MKW98_010266 [Papaver atlanticum]|uniref:Uncharacterized protein n=1 Tax=Papaver atlanticum TaxID=357466 RepID=A0AAD4SLT7_9MAGN|nr:hypothetical protein MKW98_010266 [Papaver atlanticum]
MRSRRMDNNKRVNADPSSDSPRSDSKLGEEKRKFPGSEDIAGENIDHGHDSKRIKMRDIESILQSQGSGTHCPDKTSISKNAKNQCQSSLKEEVVVVPKTKEIPKFIDLTMEEPEIPSPKNVPLRVDGSSSSNKQIKDLEIGSQVRNVYKVVPKNPFQPSIFVCNQLKPREDSECGSSTGPIEENESLRRWKEMKQNGFLSSTSTTAPVAVPPPKRRVKKTNNIKEIKSTNVKSVNMKTTNVKSVSMRTTKCTKSSDAMKKRMEIAKKEEINRFTKVAAPSGLLNGLNPGIITHVRNSKQVHSIIEALVRSEKIQNSRKTTGAELMREIKDGNNHTDSLANFQDLGVPSFSLSVEDELAHTFNGSSKDAIYVAYKKVCSDTSGASYFTSGSEDDIFAVKLSPSMPPEYSSPNIEESASKTSISSLSIKAATVASQWLELLYQDFRGRLAAIERSKKRLQSVIQIELPLLVSREFPNEQENSIICSQSSSTNEHHYARVKDIHRSRWSGVFDQMEKQLYEEGKQLERWLNQVKEMQLHCEWGLQCVNWHDFQLQKSEDDSRLKKGSKPDKELSVMAAAASIYSTCNLVMAKGNVF